MLGLVLRTLRAGAGIEWVRLQQGALGFVTAVSLMRAAVLILLVATGVLCFGLYRSLSSILPAWQAGALVALLLVLVAAFAMFTARALIAPRSADAGQRARGAGSTSATPGSDAATRELMDAGKAMSQAVSGLGLRTSDLMLAALVAGVVVASTRRKREGDAAARD